MNVGVVVFKRGWEAKSTVLEIKRWPLNEMQYLRMGMPKGSYFYTTTRDRSKHIHTDKEMSASGHIIISSATDSKYLGRNNGEN